MLLITVAPTVSKTEIQLLWQRFLLLGPGEDGALDRAVFQRSPYDEDIFCRQVSTPMDLSLMGFCPKCNSLVPITVQYTHYLDMSASASTPLVVKMMMFVSKTLLFFAYDKSGST